MPPVPTLLQWRFLILGWLIVWIATVPLFHVHIPDITDQWSALHSGGAHTVLTRDLPGEFSPPIHDNQPGHSGHLSQRGVNSPELGIGLFNEKSDDRKVKARNNLTVPYRFSDTPLVPSELFALAWSHWKPPLPQAFSPARAPPRVLSQNAHYAAFSPHPFEFEDTVSLLPLHHASHKSKTYQLRPRVWFSSA